MKSRLAYYSPLPFVIITIMVVIGAVLIIDGCSSPRHRIEMKGKLTGIQLHGWYETIILDNVTSFRIDTVVNDLKLYHNYSFIITTSSPVADDPYHLESISEIL